MSTELNHEASAASASRFNATDTMGDYADSARPSGANEAQIPVTFTTGIAGHFSAASHFLVPGNAQKARRNSWVDPGMALGSDDSDHAQQLAIQHKRHAATVRSGSLLLNERTTVAPRSLSAAATLSDVALAGESSEPLHYSGAQSSIPALDIQQQTVPATRRGSIMGERAALMHKRRSTTATISDVALGCATTEPDVFSLLPPGAVLEHGPLDTTISNATDALGASLAPHSSRGLRVVDDDSSAPAVALSSPRTNVAPAKPAATRRAAHESGQQAKMSGKVTRATAPLQDVVKTSELHENTAFNKNLSAASFQVDHEDATGIADAPGEKLQEEVRRVIMTPTGKLLPRLRVLRWAALLLTALSVGLSIGMVAVSLFGLILEVQNVPRCIPSLPLGHASSSPRRSLLMAAHL